MRELRDCVLEKFWDSFTAVHGWPVPDRILRYCHFLKGKEPHFLRIYRSQIHRSTFWVAANVIVVVLTISPHTVNKLAANENNLETKCTSIIKATVINYSALLFCLFLFCLLYERKVENMKILCHYLGISVTSTKNICPKWHPLISYSLLFHLSFDKISICTIKEIWHYQYCCYSVIKI